MSNKANPISHVGDAELPSFIRLRHTRRDDSILYPMDFEQKDLDDALRYEAQDSDIFICTYPKCGTTWMQNIVWLIVHNGEPIPGKLRHSIPMLEFDGAEAAEKIDNSVFPRILKSHFPYNWVPHNPKTKYVYVAREPKDAMVSFFYHCKGFDEHYQCKNLNFSKLFDLYMSGDVEFGSYFDHVSGWYVKRNDPNVLFVLYEDLKRDIRSELLKVGKFLGEKYEKALLADDGMLLDDVIKKSSLKTMKSQEDKWTSSQRTENLPFIRKGIVGDWKNHLSEEQVAIVNQKLKEKGGDWGRLWDNNTNVE